MKRFLEMYPSSGRNDAAPSPVDAPHWLMAPRYAAVMSRYASSMFGGGLFRLHSQSLAHVCTDLAIQTFPYTADDVWCFGADWIGRQFALQRSRCDSQSENLVLLMDPNSGEKFEIDEPFGAVFDGTFVDEPDACFEITLFRSWTAAGNEPPPFGYCAGLTVPAFLGGEYDLPNLQVVDLTVHWELISQLMRKVRDLPEGTQIRDVTLEDG